MRNEQLNITHYYKQIHLLKIMIDRDKIETQKQQLDIFVVSDCCPKCGHHYIYDIGYDNWECGNYDCNHTFRKKSKTGLESTEQ